MTDDERKELQKELRRVVCAANRLLDGTLLIGARHWDTHMRDQADRYLSEAQQWSSEITENTFAVPDQGFIDQFGNFLT